MLSEPKVVERAEQPFAAIVLDLTQPEIAGTAPPLIGEVVGWLAARGIKPNGAPFFNYVAFSPGGRMEMQVGVPIAGAIPGEGRIVTGSLPAGRYASVTHTGPYHELHDANMSLDTWARGQGLAFAGREEGNRFLDATRLEIYHNDPGEDPSGHPVTEVAFHLKD